MSGKYVWNDPPALVVSFGSKSAAAGAGIVGTAVDNLRALHRWMSAELAITEDASTIAGENMDLYLIYAMNGSTYERGDASTKPDKAAVATFEANGSAGSYRQTLSGIQLPPMLFTPLIWNATSGAISAASLRLHFYDERTV